MKRCKKNKLFIFFHYSLYCTVYMHIFSNATSWDDTSHFTCIKNRNDMYLCIVYNVHVIAVIVLCYPTAFVCLGRN